MNAYLHEPRAGELELPDEFDADDTARGVETELVEHSAADQPEIAVGVAD